LKVFLSSLGSLLGAYVDLLPYWARVILAFYVVLCCCALLTLVVMRDVRNYRAGR
jgi:hypothetical protein